MQIKVKKLKDNAKLPKKAHPTDAAYDLVATSKEVTQKYIEYGLGLALEIPQGFAGFIYPRSSISKTDLSLCNSIGVIDSNYRGEVKLRFNYEVDPIYIDGYEVGDRIGQLIIREELYVDFVESDELDETDRSTGGFGSTGA